jgi:hypothetical protein
MVQAHRRIHVYVVNYTYHMQAQQTTPKQAMYN